MVFRSPTGLAAASTPGSWRGRRSTRASDLPALFPDMPRGSAKKSGASCCSPIFRPSSAIRRDGSKARPGFRAVARRRIRSRPKTGKSGTQSPPWQLRRFRLIEFIAFLLTRDIPEPDHSRIWRRVRLVRTRPRTRCTFRSYRALPEPMDPGPRTPALSAACKHAEN